MIKIILHSGIAGLLALVVTVVLTVAIILVAFLTKGPKPLAVLALVALLPLVVGALGTFAGYAQVRSTAAQMEIGEATVEAGQREARGATFLGLSCTVFLWFICGAAAIAKRERVDSLGGH